MDNKTNLATEKYAVNDGGLQPKEIEIQYNKRKSKSN